MTPFLGIDHPLLLFKNLDSGIEQFRRMGFNPAPVGFHPWGTSMSFVTLQHSAFELMSVYDSSLIDLQPVGSFRFGRYIHERLGEREGLSLVALFSSDVEGDARTVIGRGVESQGTIKFERGIRLPDGSQDRTSCTLQILFDPAFPRVSHFICQQHRPDLVWRPELLTHPNGAIGFASVTYFAAQPDRLLSRFRGLYGDEAVALHEGGLSARTGNGVFEVLDHASVLRRFGSLPSGIDPSSEPAGIAVTVKVESLAVVAGILDHNRIGSTMHDERLLVDEPGATANVYIEFVEV